MGKRSQEGITTETNAAKPRQIISRCRESIFLNNLGTTDNRKNNSNFGTTQSVIARLEDADYEGHSLSILAHIAAALNQKVEIKILPKK